MVRARLSHCSTNLVIVVPIQAMLELHVVSSKETVTLLITSNAHTSIRARTSSSPVTFFFLSYFTLFLLTNISSFQSVRIRIDRRVIRRNFNKFASRIATVRRNGAFVVGPNAISLVTFFFLSVSESQVVDPWIRI